MKRNDIHWEILIYIPPNYKGPKAMDATIGVKFSKNRVILDEWYIFGGTKWSRTKFRMKHPVVYSKRGLRNLYRRIRRLFIKDKLIFCRLGDVSKINGRRLHKTRTNRS